MTRRPLFGSLACRLNNLRETNKADEATALLDAHNRVRAVFGQPPYDEGADWTDCPMEGLVTCVAAIDRVVTKSVRRAA